MRISLSLFGKSLAAILLVAGLGQAARADDKAPMAAAPAAPVILTSDNCGQGGCCDSDSCKQGGVIAEAEITIFEYHRIGGMQTGINPGDNVHNTFDAAPRLTLGYVGPGGLGARVRWWDFSNTHYGADPTAFVAVDTFTVDFEVFDTFKCSDCLTLEASAGIRWNGFQERMFDGDDIAVNRFYGWGGIFGLEAHRSLGRSGALYARSRLAILMDDKSLFDTTNGTVIFQDAVLGTIELAFGYEFSRPLKRGGVLFGRVGAEWQLWHNYSSNPDVSTDFTDHENQSDVGFAGLVLAVGIRR